MPTLGKKHFHSFQTHFIVDWDRDENLRRDGESGTFLIKKGLTLFTSPQLFIISLISDNWQLTDNRQTIWRHFNGKGDMHFRSFFPSWNGKVSYFKIISFEFGSRVGGCIFKGLIRLVSCSRLKSYIILCFQRIFCILVYPDREGVKDYFSWKLFVSCHPSPSHRRLPEQPCLARVFPPPSPKNEHNWKSQAWLFPPPRFPPVFFTLRYQDTEHQNLPAVPCFFFNISPHFVFAESTRKQYSGISTTIPLFLSLCDPRPFLTGSFATPSPLRIPGPPSAQEAPSQGNSQRRDKKFDWLLKSPIKHAPKKLISEYEISQFQCCRISTFPTTSQTHSGFCRQYRCIFLSLLLSQCLGCCLFCQRVSVQGQDCTSWLRFDKHVPLFPHCILIYNRSYSWLPGSFASFVAYLLSCYPFIPIQWLLLTEGSFKPMAILQKINHWTWYLMQRHSSSPRFPPNRHMASFFEPRKCPPPCTQWLRPDHLFFVVEVQGQMANQVFKALTMAHQANVLPNPKTN